LQGNPGFTTTSSAIVPNLKELQIILTITPEIGTRINLLNKQHGKIQKLRFPEFEREWERKGLGEIVDRVL